MTKIYYGRKYCADGEYLETVQSASGNHIPVISMQGYAHDTVSTKTLDAAETAYNFVEPRAGHRITVTGILLSANNNVGVGDAMVVVYEAASPTSTVATKTIFATEMQTNSSRDITGIQLDIQPGVWINAKTDDDDVFASILYYYIPE
jgi:hypothetical protein